MRWSAVSGRAACCAPAGDGSAAMVATLDQMASAEFYLRSQRSYRHPNEYYTAGEEQDGTWFNPNSLFGLEDGGKIDSRDFHRLYDGFAPDGAGKLTLNAGRDTRSPGLDMTFSADKSISALWAIAERDMRAVIERLAVDAVRAALEDTVLEYCSYTRARERRSGVQTPVPADLMGATFLYGRSKDGDPQMHIRGVIMNVTRTRRDGKYRAHHQHPVYRWSKAAGALFRAYLAWDLRQSLGVHMEQYGPNGEYTRILGMPADLLSFWSKRRKAIVDKAEELGVPVHGNAARLVGVNILSRDPKLYDNDPEIRHRRWRGEAETFTGRKALIAAITGGVADIPQEAIRKLTKQLDDLPAHLAGEKAEFYRPDIVAAAANLASGLLARDAVKTAIEQVRLDTAPAALDETRRTAEAKAGMAHTERYSIRSGAAMEQAVRDMAERMAADTGHVLPVPAIEAKIESLQADGYPLSGGQIPAIRFAAAHGGRLAVIEVAAGACKTTALRPITDLHRDQGYDIVPTAVSWRAAVALGNDCEARPFGVGTLLKQVAHKQIKIARNTLIVADEAEMLSIQQTHHILQLSERHGAKIVFVCDTHPVEEGPGLHLIRVAVDSVRVDLVNRRKTDIEDVLVHVHGETPEEARSRVRVMPAAERNRIVAAYEALSDSQKAAFTPWRTLASEALREGDAASAVEAWHIRGRFHLCQDGEATLTRLVEDWARHERDNPEASSIVLARAKAGARALTHLMRESKLAGRPGTRRFIVEVSRDAEDGRLTEPLEIAVGDRLRIGATQWQKQLFNGAIVTVEDLKAVRNGAGTGAEEALPSAAPSVLVSARTSDGRQVIFHHDEIRDYKNNICIDYGYALTIASAQGLVVDRAFLLADEWPARAAIYPAAARHGEDLDIYVNRAPLAFAIAEGRPKDQVSQPVVDADIRAYLAKRWSSIHAPDDDREGLAPGAPNDDAMVRIADEIRQKATAWRHGEAVGAFAAGRREVLAAWDDLRIQIRRDGDKAALSPAFEETLARHASLLEAAAPFRARPARYEQLLAERGGIGQKDLDAFEALYARVGKLHRSVAMKAVHARRRASEPGNEQGDGTG